MKKQFLFLTLLIKTSLFASLLDINQFIEYSDYSDSSEKVVQQGTNKNKTKSVHKESHIKQTLLSTMLALSVYEQKRAPFSSSEKKIDHIPHKPIYKPQPTKDCRYRKKQINNRIQQYRK